MMLSLKVLALFLLADRVTSFQCEDDIYRDCERRAAAGECEGKGRSQNDKAGVTNWMLAQCRESCRRHYKEKSLPKIIQTYGGLEDHVVDTFGFKMPLCPENGGFTMDGRQTILNLIALNEEQPEWVPKFTEVGFEKVKIPPNVFDMLQKEYERLKPFMFVESCARAVINCEQIINDGGECRLHSSKRTFMMEPSHVVKNKLKEALHPMAETWANVKLKHEATYGIRRYTNGSWLTSHVDRFNTHVVSAILNIGQDVDEDWPLHIMDNSGNQHAVTMEAGEMVWYESARAIHGRPAPLNGKYFDNLFIHYSPVGDWYNKPYEIGKKPRNRPITLEDIQLKQ